MKTIRIPLDEKEHKEMSRLKKKYTWVETLRFGIRWLVEKEVQDGKPQKNLQGARK